MLPQKYHSEQLVWQLIKNHHAYLIKNQNGKIFSSEPFNLRNKHSPRYSGFVKNSAIDIQPNKNAPGVIISTRSGKSGKRFKPASQIVQKTLKKDFRKGVKAVKALTKEHRHDLLITALARYSRIKHSQRARKGITKRSAKTKKTVKK